MRSSETCRLKARKPRGPNAAAVMQTDPDVVRAFLEDAAHYPGGHALGVATPRSEADVAALVQAHRRVLPIGAQSSLTGGATPMGDVVVRTAGLAEILDLGRDTVRVQAGVPFTTLQEALDREHLHYPAVPTFTGAFIGGAVATNAAGATAFKYGSTRTWVRGLTVVLASGDVLDLTRGETVAREGHFEIEGTDGRVVRVPLPAYTMPPVVKHSAGYYARPGMDLLDLFVGSEGTLGIVTEATLRVIDRGPERCLAFVQFADERQGLAVVAALRAASEATWQSGDPAGIDAAGIECLDRRCLALLREDGHDRKCGIDLPASTALAILVHLELPSATTAAGAFDEIGSVGAPGAPDTPLVRFCRLLADAGALDQVTMALPGDRRCAEQLLALREAVPAAVNDRVGLAQRTVDAAIEKVGADMIVPFEHFTDMLQIYREGFGRRGIDYAIWGHISDGNVHPNVIPRSARDVSEGKDAILEFGREVIRRGGCPLAEHGVGRNPIKHALLKQLYGDEGIDEMRAVKRALDPEWKLAPGIVFPES
jgi:D-lactate dehydrogenase (cytochrome)